jgi:L,D-peptidoglycan transpeptidase YkuD (ErfK/YbiS/YcfS/YnhG family)
VRTLTVSALTQTGGLLVFDDAQGAAAFPCTLGKQGIGHKTREGDNLTPIGVWSLDAVYYRPDRVPRPITALPLLPVTPWCGWSDDAGDAAYNQYIVRPTPFSHERLWREDGAYDLVVVIGYNRHPVLAGRGSALFIHCLNPDNRPTAGCIALERSALQHLVSSLQVETLLRVVAS